IMASFINSKEANYELVALCKQSNDNIQIDYMDSMHGISDIKKNFMGDTLDLKIYVSIVKRQKEFKFSLGNDIKVIRIGSRIVKVDELKTCPNVYSGEDALKKLKDMENK
ncbi:MAG TPA: hypothetical protein PK758_07020, partial [Tenuifilaceae bacterium]|nr:hypothetical protein [Tenuifilaceae bacterium]